MIRRIVCWFGLLAAVGLGSGCEETTNLPALGVVRGRVARIYSEMPIAGARVSVAGESAVTAADGSFQIDHVEQGTTEITVQAVEYRPLSRPLEIVGFQSLEFALVPIDTLVDVSGRVAHRVDGPLRAQLELDADSIWTDRDGTWNLAEVPIGPRAISITSPPYNPYHSQILVHSDGQFFDHFMTRDSTVTWPVVHDAYIFTQDDSLNANRGHDDFLLVSAAFGRTAIFALDPPSWTYDWADIVAARLDLHGFLLAEDDGPVGPQTLELRVGYLDTLFAEGAVDFFNRPAIRPVRSTTVSLAPGPDEQPFSVDLLPVNEIARPGAFWGAALGASAEQAVLVIISNDYGGNAAPQRPRAAYTYRF